MDLHVVNPDPRYDPPAFAQAPPAGWLHIGASVAPPAGPPFVRGNAARTALLARLSVLADDVRAVPGVRQVSVYRAVLIPPLGQNGPRPARFDVAVLIETVSVDDLDSVRDAPAVARMVDAARVASRTVSVTTARCARFLGPVDRERQGLFLFNHFTAPEEVGLPVAIALWEHLAGWYVAETGLTNSTLLVPTGDSDYLMINHARWDVSVPRLAAAQFLKRSFRSYVRANLRAHGVVAMPVLYRLVPTARRAE